MFQLVSMKARYTLQSFELCFRCLKDNLSNKIFINLKLHFRVIIKPHEILEIELSNINVLSIQNTLKQLAFFQNIFLQIKSATLVYS